MNVEIIGVESLGVRSLSCVMEVKDRQIVIDPVRGAGYCAGCNLPGYANQIPGRGFGMGWRGGRGFGWGGGWRRGGRFYGSSFPRPLGYYVPPALSRDEESEAKFLRSETTRIKDALDEIGISASSNKPLTRPAVTDLGPPRRSLGDWLGSALDFLVYDLGPAIEGIIRTDRQQKSDNAASFRHTGNARREKRGRRRSGRKARRRRRGRQ